MRRFSHMTFEQLLDKYEELTINDEKKIDVMGEKIDVIEAMYLKVKTDRNHEYRPSLNKIKQDLVLHLVRYGSYVKTEYKKDDHVAEYSLKRALRYDEKNQLAHYRLGFIYYKKKNYAASTTHFQSALKRHRRKGDSQFMLTPQQEYYATLYLSNSALHIAKQSQESLDKMGDNIERIEVSNLELSPLYKVLSQREEALLNHAFKVTSRTEERYCSLEECDRIIESNTLDQLILDLSGRDHVVYYGDQGVGFTLDQAEILEILMQESSEGRPATKYKFPDNFSVKEDGEIPNNTYTQAVRRLRVSLSNLGFPDTVIKNKRYGEDTGYYFDPSLSYQVIRRIDEL